MEKYKEYVANLAKSGTNNTFINSDEQHAEVVFENLFPIAKEYLRIFASCLCSPVVNSKYIENLSDFIERGGKVRVLLNEYEEEKSQKSNLFLRLAYYKSLRKDIVLKSTDVKPYYANAPENKVHFTIADNNAYRIETDTEKRTANCNFNNEEVGKGLVEFFDNIFNNVSSKEIDLLGLFNLQNNGNE